MADQIPGAQKAQRPTVRIWKSVVWWKGVFVFAWLGVDGMDMEVVASLAGVSGDLVSVVDILTA